MLILHEVFYSDKIQAGQSRKDIFMEIKVKKLSPDAKMPTRATDGSAGFDLYVHCHNPMPVNPGDIVKVPTGISIALPDENYAAFIYARSGLATKFGITLANCVGVVDSDYRGEIIISVCNLSKKKHIINPFERIAQMVIAPIAVPSLCEVGELPQTKRGDKGFGSTGR